MRKAAQRGKHRTVAYLRVSTDTQDTKKNEGEIARFANERDFGKVEFITEKISGMRNWKERKLKTILDELGEGDRLIVPEMTRLGRASMMEIMEILSYAKERKISVYDVKNNWELNDSLQSEVMAFAFSIASRIEHDLILQRTEEGRRAAMKQGVKFGRKPGPGKSKLDPYREEIENAVKLGVPQTRIARKYKVTPATVYNWLKKHNLHGIKA